MNVHDGFWLFTYNINGKASRFFTYADLINCGATALEHNIENLPLQPDTWRALSLLATQILDPIVDQFGPISLTYGFCSPELVRKIAKNRNPHIAPKLDQHCSHELNQNQKIIFAFPIEMTTRSFSCHLVVSIWFLVTDCSNEKNIWFPFYQSI